MFGRCQIYSNSLQHSVMTGWQRVLFICLVGLSLCRWSEGGIEKNRMEVLGWPNNLLTAKEPYL